MPKKYPPLTPSEVVDILRANGFRKDRRGNHDVYVGEIRGLMRSVPVKMNVTAFDNFLIQSMIRQSGLTREEFYGSTRQTGLKIGLKPSK